MEQGIKHHQTNQILPNFSLHPPALQHTKTQCAQKYNSGGWVTTTIYQWERTPHFHLKNQF